MEKFLLRAKVEEWEHIEGRYVFRWAEGYLNLEGITEKGPVFSFAELEKGTCVSHMHTRKNGEWYVYRPVEHSHYIKDTISRWTGLLDKNGKKIWEGDIVTYEWDKQLIHMLVRFVGGEFLMTPINETVPCEYWDIRISGESGYVEVVGNRWDNPELMKGE